MRRTIRIDEDNITGIQKYRSEFLSEGEEKTFPDAVNEVLEIGLEIPVGFQKGGKPTDIDTPKITCMIWGNCVYGAGCIFSLFKATKPKETPRVTIIDGKAICHDHKRG